MTGPVESAVPSPRSRGIALAMAALLGPFGAHRFYVGKTRSGILMCATLGGAGIWYLYDLILVAAGSFRDAEGRLVSRWDPEYAFAEGTTEALLDQVDALRAEVADLTERVEFAERLLARPRADLDEPSTLRRS